jgi:predicted nucleic acid-binding protein
LKFILDTGPLVALLNRRDQHHRWAWEQWARMEAPLFTCEPVIAEACFLVQGLEGGPATVLDFVRRGVLDLSFCLADESEVIARLMNKYHDVPMSLADGCLVRMAERYSDGIVVTLDNDFTVYRKNGRQPVPTATPVS